MPTRPNNRCQMFQLAHLYQPSKADASHETSSSVLLSVKHTYLSYEGLYAPFDAGHLTGDDHLPVESSPYTSEHYGDKHKEKTA
jgi:hypothetical protein